MLSQTEQQEVDEMFAILKSQRSALSGSIAKSQSLGEWNSKPPTGTTAVVWYEELAKRLLRAKKTFLVTSPDINVLLEQTRNFRSVIDNNLSGVYQTGTLEKLLVFVDPFFPMDLILMGNGSLDDPGNFVIRDPAILKATHLLD